MSEIIAGIDLGTTNSEIAVVIDGQVRMLPVNGHPILPSCVGINPAGELVVGQTARNQIIAAPDSTISSIKRRMGEDIAVPLGGRQFSPEEISSFVLRELKLQAEKELGQSVSKAVITVPAFFNERQRRATQVAGELAGLEVVRILNEPTAAALAYGAGATDSGTMLVYDLGGGTFDVSVVVVEDGVVEVKASHGDTHLGGDDFDDLLVDYAAREFEKQHGIDLRQQPLTLRRLKVIMERAKRTLSDEPVVRVREEYLDGKHHLEFEILRSDYEKLILPLVEKTLICVHQSLTDARLSAGDVGKVMLVGGATRTPLVQEMLLDRLQIEPHFEIDPDLIVAMGAAVQGGVLAGDKRHSILVDITSHTLSIAALLHDEHGDYVACSPIIRRNTPLPASKAEIYHTIRDEQERVLIQTYQGEGHTTDENQLIGEFWTEGLSKVPEGNPVVVQFSLNLDGMLKVTATEKNTGLSKTVTLDTRGENVLDIEEARKNIAALVSASDESDASDDGDSPHETVKTAVDLKKRVELLLTKNISAEDAAEIREIIRQADAAVVAGDLDDLARKNEALDDLLFYLED
ncbi:MAG TPA: Hsp70 family protein [Chthoniobacterales bacterium]